MNFFHFMILKACYLFFLLRVSVAIVENNEQKQQIGKFPEHCAPLLQPDHHTR